MLSRRILIIEDDRAVRDALEELFREANIETHSAEDGESAIERLSRQSFDAILLDLHLPNLSGFDILDYIRNDRPELLSRVVVVSGLPIATIEARAPELRDRVFLKPYNGADLLRCVEGYVALHSG